MYKLLRSPSQKNPHPVLVREEYTGPTSKQLQDYVLCEECENRFHERGENWVMECCCRDAGAFKFRAFLDAAAPLSENPDIRVYRTADITACRTEQLVYFAMSVFWRAAVHRWRIEGSVTSISLGPYEEKFRQLLLDRAGFPEGVALSVRVTTREELLKTAYSPNSGNYQGFHAHRFSIPGFMFLCIVGSKIPPGFLAASTAPGPEGLIAIHPKSEAMDLEEMIRFAIRSQGGRS
jgi:hypothetical protein